MKTILTCAIVAVMAIGSYAQGINGCFGVTFGSTQQEVKAMMAEKHKDALLLTNKPNVLGYSDGTWALRDVYVWVFSFDNNGKLFCGSVLIKPTSESLVYSLYDEISQDMTDKYGSPTTDIENWSYPYTAKDKYTFGYTAIKIGKADFFRSWVFPNETQTTDDDNNIVVKITDDLNISVRYQDGEMVNKLKENESNTRKGEL